MRKLWIILTYLVFILLIAAPLGKMATEAFSDGFSGFGLHCRGRRHCMR